MDKDYKEIYVRDILNEVKRIVVSNKIKIEGLKQKETDEKLLKVINDLCNKDIAKDEPFNLIVTSIFTYDKNRIINMLVLYYVAIYFDNVDLLKFLLDKDFNFIGDHWNGMNLFVLDKDLSSNFDFKEYYDLLIDNVKLFKNFYLSLDEDYDISNDDSIEMFVRIIKNNPDIAKLNNGSLSKRVDNILNKEVFSIFKEETIINLDDEQKCIINRKFSNRNMYKQEKDIIHNLIEKYNYSNDLVYWKDFIRDFEISELLEMDEEKIKVICATYSNNLIPYEVSNEIKEKAIKCLKELFDIKPDYNYKFDALVYDVLTIDEILNLSEEGYKAINCVISKQALLWKKYNFSEKTLRYGIRYQYKKDRRRNFVKKLVKKVN